MKRKGIFKPKGYWAIGGRDGRRVIDGQDIRPSETLRFGVQTAFDANIKAVVSLVPYIFQTAFKQCLGKVKKVGF